jgi:iron complex transport system permease protein
LSNCVAKADKKEFKVRKRLKLRTIMLICIPIVVIILFISIGVGSTNISPLTTLKVICSQIPILKDVVKADYTTLDYNMVIAMRLPRVLLAFIVGASLAVCGVTMQALVRNKLADPFILGVSSGASATAALFSVFGVFSFLGQYSLPLSSFIGAALSIIFVYMLSKINGRMNISQLLLAGVAVAMIMDAVTSLILISAPDAFATHNINFWLSGSLTGAKWSYLTLPLIVILVCSAFLMFNYRTLNVLVLGEETAGTLGINVSRMQKALVLVASLLAGVAISVSGSIGFVGLMVPHICRMLVGADHKRILPLSMLLGGLTVVIADVAARVIAAPDEIPVGILTAFVGAPFFVVMLKNKRTARTMI